MALKDLAKMVNEASKTKPVEDEFLYDLGKAMRQLDLDEARDRKSVV